MTIIKKLLAGSLLLCAGPAFAANFTPNYDESNVGEYTLPRALSEKEASNPQSAKQLWEQSRRTEVLELFREHVYGKPLSFGAMKIRNVSPKTRLADAKGFRQTVDLELNGRTVQLLLTMPESKKPVPVFIGYNFCGNHSVIRGTFLPVSPQWANPSVCADKVDATAPTTENNRFTPESRGIRAYRWPENLILSEGFGFVTLYYGDILPDAPQAFRDFIGKSRPGESPDEYSAIGVWAAGLSSVMDYLVTRPDIDRDNVIVFGHSRLGKTALWAGANDQRFSMVISNNSGEGGAALARRNYGETLGSITQDFPHWFNKKYASYGEDTNALPVDQHLLMALVAPRPLYVASAQNDQWADPKGEFLSVRNAEQVYKLYTSDVFSETEFPATETPLHSRLSYHYRKGAHDVFTYDWQQYLTVAKKYLR